MGRKKKHKQQEAKENSRRKKNQDYEPYKTKNLSRELNFGELNFDRPAVGKPAIKVVLYLKSPKDLESLKTHLIDLIPTSESNSKDDKKTIKKNESSEFLDLNKSPETDRQISGAKKKTVLQHIKDQILNPQVILVTTLTVGHFLFQQYSATILAAMAKHYPLVGVFAIAFSLCFSKEASGIASSVNTTVNAISGFAKLVDLIGKFTERPVVN